ncbi:response regulator transcription factor [Novosphingobium sp. AAP93]|uniref:response regulator n=1 Tax=Novosphingobium sp. AAP93 TaxID=1523427 RepID=UPI0006B9F274|nr:response regulator transcription factor [Novosphingobium sp. AAP93]KPF80838.1 transcriptional regulator [Novosphingobium sp. AAP93]
MARVLIIEDNERLAGLIADGLAAQGHVCDAVHTLASAEDALAATSFDGIVLDLGLPDGDGVDWMRAQHGPRPPILVLTARDALEDRIKGLDAGADDYLPKPFAMSELAARLRALLRRPGGRQDAVLSLGNVAFDPASQQVTVDAHPLDLTRREAALIELLLRRAGQVVRRAVIESSLYTFDEAVTPNAVEANISRLRRKLEEAGAALELHTIRGVGYIARVRGA